MSNNILSGWQIEQAMSVFQSLERNFNPETDCEALEIAQTDVHTMLHRVIRAAMEAESMSEMCKARAADLAERKARYDRRAEQLRGVAFAVMDVLGESKIVAPDFTVSIRSGSQRVIITDENAVPDEYKKTVVSVDKKAVNDAAKEGVVIPGVEWSNALPSLTIRSK